MKKLMSIALALILVLAMAAPAMAEATDGYTITINNATEGHTYEAYQIFTGDLSGNTLSNIVWGDGVTEAGQTAMGAAAAKAETITTEALAVAFADEVAQYLGSATASSKYTAATDDTAACYTIAVTEPGYYLIKDKDASLDNTNDAYTKYMLKIVKDTDVDPKSDVPEVVKKVDDKNDSDTSEDATNWQDSADYDIGDSVPFQLKATLANNVSAYATYKVVFHDTLSDGLTLNATYKTDSEGAATTTVATGVTVKMGDTDVTSYFTITCEDNELTISCDNVKEFGATDSSVIVVEYTATLNENAVIGSTGNPNTVKLEYSNNPNWKPEDTDGDGDVDDDDGDEPTGETPEDKVIVFTYKVVVNKVQANPDYDETVEGSQATIPLKGAGFTLYKWDIKTAATEDTAAVYDWVAVGEELKGTDMTTFTWERLDDGKYQLVETTTPAGYNTIAPIDFTITAEHEVLSDNPTLTKLEGGDLFTGEVSTGTLTGDVVNVAGTILPETGGIGTTIFYVAGGLLMVGALVLLITKRKVESK